MGQSVHVVWDGALTQYDFGRGHPLNPVRLDLTMRLARALGVLEQKNVEIVSPPMAGEELLTSFHTVDYVAAVRKCAEHPESYDFAHGLGTEDNPCFRDMHDASARVAGGTVDIALAVWEGRARHGVNITGGLHHAMASNASGFCVYNDVAIGIKALLQAGAQRVAYVDVDVHHGDGVQAAFYDDARVLTISLHETPRTLFPGTGFPEETGGKGAQGSAVNVALPPGTTDAGWLPAFHPVGPPPLRGGGAPILRTQAGGQTH